MPGEPGPRYTGDAPHASDAPVRRGGDTPYGGTVGLPMTTLGTVGGRPYIDLSSRTRPGDRP